MRRLELTDPRPPNEAVKLLLTQGEAGDWGELEPLRGTSWGEGVKVVSAESMSHALHGHFLPLFRELGRDPHASGRKVSDVEGLCKNLETCPISDPKLCRPGGRVKKKVGPAGCYEPPLKDTPPEISAIFYMVTQAWKEGRHTLVVVGEGFNLR